MQRQVVGLCIKLLDAVHLLHAVSLEYLCIGDERIESDHIHTQRLALTTDELADVAVSMDRQRLAFQLAAGTRCELVAGHEDHHTERQFSHGVRILTRSIHHHDTFSRCGSQVHIVITGTRTNDDLEILGSFDHLGSHFIAADNQGVGIGNGCEQLGLVRIFLQKGYFVTGIRNDLLNSINSLLCERLLGCN